MEWVRGKTIGHGSFGAVSLAKPTNRSSDFPSIMAKSGGFRLPESEVRRYTRSILNGLQFIHRNGFVHCDIKLQNILLVSDGVTDAVKIADFGLAKKTIRTGELNSKNEIRGTPMYMAPETVAVGEQEPASDIWALGCIVVEMVTGEPVWNCSDVGDWESEQFCSLSPEFDCLVGEDGGYRSESPSIPPAARLGQLLTARRPDWCDSNSWVNVR
ncbi:hypothetical protein E3N88_06759 [Mikania micrantha]|uniref:Protein kinase domain-containing protein n=1 Tax=Mikania micrantha TaxID=192012 RepID=A0A5N6PPM1_9ASTR|nr:hypothetical protein E3N88_06759 [Mikania micrantha]